MNESTLALLRTRRSVKPDLMTEPGPTPVQLEEILTIAARVPDHKKLVPWRFIVFTGDARSSFGERIAKACQAEDTMPPSNVRLEAERNRFLRAPVVVAVISRVEAKPGAPEWEQILSAGAAAMNLCIAANAMGFVTNWLTEWIAFDEALAEELGCRQGERIAGFIHIGTRTAPKTERDRPQIETVFTRMD